MKGCISAIEDHMAPLQRDVKYHNHITAQHAACLNDLQNRMHRNNVRAIGIPEKAEGKNPVAFIEQWLLLIFAKEAFSPMFAVERAHRVPARPLPPGNYPQPFLFKLLNYKDTDAILSKARQLKNTLVINNSKVSPFPIFSAELQKHHTKFQNVENRLRGLNLQYAMLYPACLWVVTRGEVHFFDNPVSAMQ